jgi:hypothetical protein
VPREMVSKETMATRLLRIHRIVMWLLCVTTTVLCMERFGGESGEGLRFRDWSRVLATAHSPNWRQDGDYELGVVHEQVVEEEHRIAGDDLRQWLTPTDKWHFVVGYSDVRAYSAARRLTQGARIHHLPTRTSLHFFLVFITAASATAIRHHRLFHVVEPLLPYLKIEDLTLGRLIREEDEEEDAEHALKAVLAHNALTLREVASLAERWEVALAGDPSLQITTLRYTDAGGQMGIHETTKPGSAIECRVSVTAIVCSGIARRALRDAAHFMASHAVVQLVELNPRYEAFNKWAKFVTQVLHLFLDAALFLSLSSLLPANPLHVSRASQESVCRSSTRACAGKAKWLRVPIQELTWT